MNIKLDEYLIEYNELISSISLDCDNRFAALASPTLNKQESITSLYGSIINEIGGVSIRQFFSIRLMFVFRLVRMFIYLMGESFRRNNVTGFNQCIYLRSWLVPKTFNNGVIIDEYFRRVVNDLSKDNKVIVGLQPLGYGQLLSEFRSVNNSNNFIIPTVLLKPMDVFNLFFKYIFSAKIKVNKKYYFKGKVINKFLNESLNEDYYSLRSFTAYLELFIAHKVKKIFNPKLLLYVFENQAWENSYLTVFNHGSTNVIGYQSSGFSLRFLNFFPSVIDCDNALFPNKILTVGSTFKDSLNQYGNYPVTIDVLGALRFDYLEIDGIYKLDKPICKIFKRILYAFPVHLYQYESIIIDLIDVFGNSDIEVHLKYHPLYFSKDLNLILPDNFLLWEDNYVLNKTYDFVLFNDNSFGIESLIMGVKSYEYYVDSVYDETRLVNFNIYNCKVNKNQLKEMKSELDSNNYDKNYSVTGIQHYISSMYTVYRRENIKYLQED